MQLTARHEFPAMYSNREFAEAGGLMSYGTSLADVYRQTGGKGVVARVLTALIGKRNVAGPTLNSLGGDFGLAPLIGKSLAVISDARFSRGRGLTVTSTSFPASSTPTGTTTRPSVPTVQIVRISVVMRAS